MGPAHTGKCRANCVACGGGTGRLVLVVGVADCVGRSGHAGMRACGHAAERDGEMEPKTEKWSDVEAIVPWFVAQRKYLIQKAQRCGVTPRRHVAR